jgi:hypothetical protein
MNLTVSSSFLLSFVIGGSGPSRVIKFLNALERPEQGDVSSFIHLLLHPMGLETSLVGFLCIKPTMHI